jgi:hypothetical protein
MPSVPLFSRQWKWNSSNEVKIPTDYIRDNFQCCERNFFRKRFWFYVSILARRWSRIWFLTNRRFPVSLYLRLTWVMKNNRKETASSEQLSCKSQLVSTCHTRVHLRRRLVPVSLTAERQQISSQQTLDRTQSRQRWTTKPWVALGKRDAKCWKKTNLSHHGIL